MLEVKRSRKIAVAKRCVTGILGLTDVGSTLGPWEV
jgi:hypothetical protein